MLAGGLAVGAAACSSSPTSVPPTGAASTTASTTAATTASTTKASSVSSMPAPSTAPATASSSVPLPVGTLCGVAAAAPARYDHVVWIWMENHTADAVLDSADAPFERSVAQACGSSRSYRSVGSPSLPNYLGASSGSTHGVRDDGSPSAHPITGDNLFRQARSAGGTSRSYEESMPGACTLEAAGRYAVKHNPQPYFVDDIDRAACQSDDVPLGTLQGGPLVDDLAGGHLPTFSFITPDLCDDTHDCSVATGDAWLRDWIGLITGSATYRAGKTLVFIVWDEPTPMPLLVIAPTVPAGTTAAQPFDHYSLLRATEDALGLPALGSAATATSMRDAFHL
jgi:Phosphoesterase family